MKVIKQKQLGVMNIDIQIDPVGLNVERFNIWQNNKFVIVLKENTRELALSICPELAEEIERMKAVNQEWQELWNPIDEYMRPKCKLGERVSVKVLEQLKSK